MKNITVFVSLLLSILQATGLLAQSVSLLWYNQPALYFEESLVLGNGKMGASVFGGVKSDKIYLNDARYVTGPDPVAAAAHMAADRVRYDMGRTKYWEIGNENYGDCEWGYRIDVDANKDGQPEYLTGNLYARHFKVFADSMKKAVVKTGKTIYIGAMMQESPTQSWQTITTKTWNTTMITETSTVTEGGKVLGKASDVQVLKKENGQLVCYIGSGKYSFRINK